MRWSRALGEQVRCPARRKGERNNHQTGRELQHRRRARPRPNHREARREWRSGYATKREAETARVDILGRLQRGEHVAPSKLTLGAYLANVWVPSIAASIRPTTLARYRLDVNTLTRELGSVPLQGLTGQHLDGLYAQRLEDGRAPASVRHLHVVVRRALRDGLRNGLVLRNAADAATPPRVPSPTPATWSADELRTFLGSVRDDRLFAAWLLAANSGLRRGELLGVAWGQVDLGSGTLQVVRSLVSVRNQLSFAEPKTKRGRRTIRLDPGTVAELRAHRRRQAEERLALGLGRPGRSDLVFTDPLGESIKPDSFSQFFDRRVTRLQLPKIRLHGLRHTHATLLLASGANVKTVSARLGHASVAFTLDTYAAALPELEEQAATAAAVGLD
jgi:integrase